MSRKKVPTAVESEVMFLSNLKCCIDNKKGDHIHHIDGNNSNNNIENLALLCFDCHNLATIKGSLSKKLSPKAIKKFREHHYQVIKTQRENSLKIISGKAIKNLTQENIIEATSTSIVLIEISKIQYEYYNEVKMNRNDILNKILIFKHQSNSRTLVAILEFLNLVVYETRSGLSSNMIYTVEEIILTYFHNLKSDIKANQFNELGKLAINIGHTIIYDTSIHSHNFKSMSIGYSILKFIFSIAIKRKSMILKDLVFETFERLKMQLQRPERNDLENAKTMRKIYLDILEIGDKSQPEYPNEILKLIQNQE